MTYVTDGSSSTPAQSACPSVARAPRHAVPRDALTGAPLSPHARYWMRVHEELNPRRHRSLQAFVPMTLNRHVTEDSAPDPWAQAEYDARPQRRANAPQGCTFSRPFARYLAPVLPQEVAIAELRGADWWDNAYVAERVRHHMASHRRGDLAYRAVLLYARDGLGFCAVRDALATEGVKVSEVWVQEMVSRLRRLLDEYRFTGKRFRERRVFDRVALPTVATDTGVLEASY